MGASGHETTPGGQVPKNIFMPLAGAALVAPLVWKRSPWTVVGALAGTGLIYCGTCGALDLSPEQNRHTRAPVTAQRVLTIGKSSEELYELWRAPESLTTIFRGVVQVSSSEDGSMHWMLSVPDGRTAEWDTEAVDDRSGELFLWRSVPGSPVQNEGRLSMKPAPHNRGTEVTLALTLDLANLPGGGLLQAAGKLSNTLPQAAVNKVLRNFKSLAETGEIPALDRNPSGRASRNGAQGDLL